MKSSATRKFVPNKGFSLIEFVVILTLFAIMSSVVTFDYQKYRGKIERSNFATDIALAFRQMQVYGISSSNRMIGGDGFETDDEAVQDIVSQDLVQDVGVFGVQVDLESQELTLYQEMGGNDQSYDEESDLVIDILKISGDNQILRICTTEGDTQPDIDAVDGTCANSFANPSEEISSGTFTVSFRRPFPDSRFDASSLGGGGADISMAIIVVGKEGLTAPELRYVYFDAIGLIQVIEPNMVNE